MGKTTCIIWAASWLDQIPCCLATSNSYDCTRYQLGTRIGVNTFSELNHCLHNWTELQRNVIYTVQFTGGHSKEHLQVNWLRWNGHLLAPSVKCMSNMNSSRTLYTQFTEGHSKQHLPSQLNRAPAEHYKHRSIYSRTQQGTPSSQLNRAPGEHLHRSIYWRTQQGTPSSQLNRTPAEHYIHTQISLHLRTQQGTPSSQLNSTPAEQNIHRSIYGRTQQGTPQVNWTELQENIKYTYQFTEGHSKEHLQVNWTKLH